MTDEETLRRAEQARQAIQIVGPVIETMLLKATADLLAAPPEDVLQRQLYARALADVKKTLEGHVRQGEFVTAARQ